MEYAYAVPSFHKAAKVDSFVNRIFTKRCLFEYPRLS